MMSYIVGSCHHNSSYLYAFLGLMLPLLHTMMAGHMTVPTLSDCLLFHHEISILMVRSVVLVM